MSAVPPAITPGATDHAPITHTTTVMMRDTITHPMAGVAGCIATNHKDIGTMYLWFSFTMFMVGGVLALGIRAELFQPGLQFWRPGVLQPAHHDARPDHGVRRDHAGVRRLRELA